MGFEGFDLPTPNGIPVDLTEVKPIYDRMFATPEEASRRLEVSREGFLELGPGTAPISLRLAQKHLDTGLMYVGLDVMKPSAFEMNEWMKANNIARDLPTNFMYVVGDTKELSLEHVKVIFSVLPSVDPGIAAWLSNYLAKNVRPDMYAAIFTENQEISQRRAGNDYYMGGGIKSGLQGFGIEATSRQMSIAEFKEMYGSTPTIQHHLERFKETPLEIIEINPQNKSKTDLF